MSRWRIGIGVAVVLALAACSADMASSFGADSSPTADAGAGASDGRNSPAATPVGVQALDNGIILVHASNASAFRLCFESEPDLLPQPDSKIMPDSNVVGVEVGTAARIDPIKGAPGKVTLYSEAVLRPYFGPGKANLSCRDLANEAVPRVNLGTVPDNLATGVHVLAVTGCVGGSGSTATCGSTYDNTNGNLGISHEQVIGYQRGSQTILPMQVMHLSQALEGARGTRNLSVVFHDENTATAKDTPIVGSLDLLAPPAPAGFPTQLPFDGSDAGSYESYSVKVELAGDGGADAGTTTVLRQTLADIQNLSSPRDLPTTYYAKASNFVLLVLGDPALVQSDGGGDPYRQLHLLAIPVVEPKPDGGADGGDGG